MKVVIAEKPSVARDLARVMGARNREEGYIDGNNYAFTWAYGHLVQLKTPEGFKEWKAGDLPILPENFELQPTQHRDPKTREWSVDEGVQRQLSVIEKLFADAEEIIVATDAGREGELIFRYIYEYLNCSKPFRRLWISSVTDEAIRAGFAQLKPGKDYDDLFHAARCRSEADWLVGINATRALSIPIANGTLSLGRVQTPTLAMICARFVEHRDFKPETYYQLQIHLEKGGIPFKALSLENFKEKAQAEQKLAGVTGAGLAEVVKVETKEKKEAPPLLYDLTALQQDANKRLNLSADQTLKLAQSLYEKKHITYPRTGSRYIGEDVFAEIPELLQKCAPYPKFQSVTQALMTQELNERSVNAAKVTDHHALLPTGYLPEKLSEDEKGIYELILGRMLEAFGEVCIKAITTIDLLASEKFRAKGTVILAPGWRSVFNESSEEDQEDTGLLPEVAEGEKLDIQKAELLTKQTKPKPLLNDGSLLKAMQTCGKDIEDEEMQEAMKENGLGTPATRAAIIETLFSRNYIARKKKAIIPTPKGLALYEALQEEKIANPELTGSWEKKLALMERGEFHPDDFLTGIYSYTREVTPRLLSLGERLKGQKAFRPQGINCPKCEKGIIKEGNKAFYCSQYKEGCEFKIWKIVAGKAMSLKNAEELITKGKTSLIKGFLSKKKAKFDAHLVVKDADTFELGFDFPPRKGSTLKKKTKNR